MIQHFSHYRVRLENQTGGTITVNAIDALRKTSDMTVENGGVAVSLLGGLTTIANGSTADGADSDNVTNKHVVGQLTIQITPGTLGTNPIVHVYLLPLKTATVPADQGNNGYQIGYFDNWVASTAQTRTFIL